VDLNWSEAQAAFERGMLGTAAELLGLLAAERIGESDAAHTGEAVARAARERSEQERE